MGQCFWRAAGVDRRSWYRCKGGALQHLTHSLHHFRQGPSCDAWANHVDIAAFAQDTCTRIVVVSATDHLVYQFEPEQVQGTIYMYHFNDYFERVSGFVGKAFHISHATTCAFEETSDPFPIETVPNPGRAVAIQHSHLTRGALKAKAPPLEACGDLGTWFRIQYQQNNIPVTTMGTVPLETPSLKTFRLLPGTTMALLEPEEDEQRNWEEEEEEASAPSTIKEEPMDEDPPKVTYHAKPSCFDEVLP